MDTLRGAALAAMAAYHGAWDLHAFGLIDIDPSHNIGWRLFGNTVAGLFLALSGFGLSLATRRDLRTRKTLLRLARLAVAAALVSLVTRIAVPEAPIWFGILHCIVVTNALAFVLRGLPGPALLIVAASAWAVPIVWHGSLGPGWAWTGLAAGEPVTLDFRPVLPWLAPVLLGMVLGRTSLAVSPGPSFLPTRALHPLAWSGRHSLLIYLGHQPLLLAALVLALGATPKQGTGIAALRDPEQAAAFLQQCRGSCVARGGDAALCRSTCDCVLTSAVGRPRPAPTRWLRLFGSKRDDLSAAVASCQSASENEGR